MSIILTVLGLVGVTAGVVGGFIGYKLARSEQIEQRLRRLETELEVKHRSHAPSKATRASESQPRDEAPTTPPAEAAPEQVTPESGGAESQARPQPARAAKAAEPTISENTTDSSPSQPPNRGHGGHSCDRPAEPSGEHPARARRTPPSVLDVALAWIRRGNTVAQLGAVVLFFGVAFLLKFTASSGLLPIELRFAATALGGLAVLVLGWRLRDRYPRYAVVVQGAGLGVLYLTTFGAIALYQLIPPALAFSVMVALTVAAVALAVLQNSFWLAALAISGAFLAPVLTASGTSSSHVVLFSYFLLLNLGILGIAWFRSWRALNVLGFVFTFGLSSIWGAEAYRPELFATVEPFLIAHVLLYIGVAVLFAARQPPRLRGLVDGTLVFGTPVVALGLQASMVQPYPYGMAISATVAGGFYVLLAGALWRAFGTTLRPLAEAFLALGIAAATLAIPLAVDGRWTAAAWALEGAGIAWVALRQQRRWTFYAGVALQLLAGLAFLNGVDIYPDDALPILNSVFQGFLLLAAAGWFTAYQIRRHHGDGEARYKRLSVGLLVWGTVWWLSGLVAELNAHVAVDWRLNVGAVLVTATAAAAGYLARVLGWRQLVGMALSLTGLVGLSALVPLQDLTAGLGPAASPMGPLGYLIWPAALGVHYTLLYYAGNEVSRRGQALAHAGGLWFGTYWLTLELAWLAEQIAGHAWPQGVLGAVPAAVLLVVLRRALPTLPDSSLARAYVDRGGPVLTVWLIGWLLLAGVGSPGTSDPLPFLPLVNPIDAAVGLTFVALWGFETATREAPWRRGVTPDTYYTGMAGAGFLWFSAAIARGVHHWGDVAYNLPALFASTVMQASWSLGWGALAVIVMALSHARGLRGPWKAGAVLCGVVVTKLFLVELANTDTLSRIVSFIGVGLLLLAVGYLAPLPPRTEPEEESP